MQKHKSELFLETEEGAATPLSLVHVEEEFNSSPSLYQGDGVAQTKEQDNIVSLARLQYNFVQEANLPTRSSEFYLTGENVSLFPERPKAHPCAKGLINDFSSAIPHQGGSLPVSASCDSLKQQGSEVIPLSWGEQNNLQDAVVTGDSSQKEGHPSKRSPPERESHPGNNTEAEVNHLPASEVHEETCAREASPVGSNSAVKPLSPIPVTHQPVSPKDTPNSGCPNCRHPSECSRASLVGQEVKATNKWVKPTSSSKEKAGKVVEKPFQCPDCGKGFLHRSSIPRHQRLHKKDNPSPNSEQQVPQPGAHCGTSFTMKPLVIKRRRLSGIDQPFKCLSCDKSYGQRNHLKRHEQQKHQVAD
ncbi:zinc finger protein [Crotalus adamanteus]|uniref:Zinc finger protein n=1 Tax=Crotalus adamanteus TaxID=8729 RepID=A0AAW1BVE1_CROAD